MPGSSVKSSEDELRIGILFERLRVVGEQMGFSHVASGPMVRSSYHADQQAEEVLHARAV